MLKLANAPGNLLHNFKCAEIFFSSPAIYDVTCFLCETKIDINQFTKHFQLLHLALAEANNLDDHAASIEEEHVSDLPIDQEEFIDEVNVDEKSWQRIFSIKETESSLDYVEKASLIEINIKIEKNPKSKIELQVPTLDSHGSYTEDEKEYYSEETLSEESDDYFNGYVDRVCSQKNKNQRKKHHSAKEDATEDERSYPCQTCKRPFHSHHGLQTHIYLAHNPNLKPRKPVGSKPTEKCDECNKVFRYPSQLRTHKFKHAGISCEICGKPFKSQADMKQHQIRHIEVKNFQCGICGKSFYWKPNLKAHLATHTNEKPFHCDMCNFTFRTRSSLRMHKIVHSGVREYVCKICGRGFTRADGLRNHMQSLKHKF